MDSQPNIWQRIRDYFAQMADENALSAFFRGPPEESIRFTIAIIALSAKMAKADGRVTIDEVRTLRQIFEFNPSDEADIAKVFDLARQDVSGYESYAKRIYSLFKTRPEMLDDIFESLFIISLSDGEFHENEALMLEHIREIFNIRESFFRCLKNRYVIDSNHDPFEILGVSHDASPADIKTAYKEIIRENHPDSMRAKGLPPETIALAENRIRAANSAYEMIGN